MNSISKQKFNLVFLTLASVFCDIFFSGFIWKQEGALQIRKRDKGLFYKECADSVADSIYLSTEQMPEFPGGEEALNNFISQNLRYPSVALENDIHGDVKVEFVVAKSGDILNIKLVKKVYFGTNEEVIRLLESMPRWTPGKQNGQKVNVKCMIIIPFKLTEENRYKFQYFQAYEQDTIAKFTDKGDDIKCAIAKKYKKPQNTSETINGKIYFNPYISNDGKIDSVYFLNGIRIDTIEYYSITDTAMCNQIRSIIMQLPAWSPAFKRGQRVKSLYFFELIIEKSKIKRSTQIKN